MPLTPNRTDFTFNHSGQPDEYGVSVGNYETVQEAFDSRGQQNLDDINNIKTYITTELEPAIDALDAANVKLTGDQEIDGVKTFASSPTVPTPTTDMQAATKKYVDDNSPVSDDSIVNAKLGTDVKIGSLAALLTSVKTSIVNAINYFFNLFTVHLAENVSLKDYGVVGDGVTDDTEAVQAAFTAANGKKLYVNNDLNCLITDTISVPDNIFVFGKGQFTCTGDVDYWFEAATAERIIYDGIKATVTMAFGSRANLNRVLYCNTPDYFEVKNVEIIGASTAVHCVNGEYFYCTNTILRNVYGTAQQYGYGVNTSARISTINGLTVENDDTTNGRHAIYINGAQWENVNISGLYVYNWNKNPIQVINTEPTAKCNYFVNNSVFINANIEPMSGDTGCIHAGDENGSGVRGKVGFLYVRNIAGPAISTQGAGNHAFSIDYLYAEELATAANLNTYLVNMRFGNNKHVGKVVCTGLTTNWLAAVSIRDCVNAIVDDVTVLGAGPSGSQALRLNNSTVTVGNVQTEGIDRIFNSGSTITPKQLNQKISYSSTIPTTGTFNVHDINWDTTPVAGSYIGWVCVTAGTLGTLNGGATTGSINTGTPTLTVNNATGLTLGCYITIAGVSGAKKVINISGTTITINSNADATVSGAAIAFSAAVLNGFGNIDLQGSATWNPGDLADGTGETSAAITVTGAALGDFVLVSAPYDLQGLCCNGYVSGTNSVKIRLQNETGGNINLADGTWKVKIIKA